MPSSKSKAAKPTIKAAKGAEQSGAKIGGSVMATPAPSGRLTVTIRGTRPLVLNQFPPRALASIRDTRTGEAKKKGKRTEDRVPRDEYEECAEKIDTPKGERRVWPARAFLRQMAEAAIALGLEKNVASKAGINRNIEVEGDAPGDPLWCVIEPAPGKNTGPAMREDMIRLNAGRGAPDVRWRMQYQQEWTTTLTIVIEDTTLYPPSLVLKLLKKAGWLGIADGAIKPSTKPMGWGKFEIATDPQPRYVEIQDEADEIEFVTE